MKKRGIFSSISFLLAAIMLLSLLLPLKAEAKGYWSADIFTADRSKKGTQSFKDTEVQDTSNIFLNVYMETSFPRDDKSDISSFTPFDFEGETYYFKIPEGIYNTGIIGGLNDKNLTVTIQLMLRYDESKARLIEPSARDQKGYPYYSPNMTEEAVVKEYRAYMEFMADLLSQYRCHVDAWVCGNEVNAPDCWNFFGTDCMGSVGGNRWVVSNQDLLIDKYSKFYDIVYNAVKTKNKKARVCICVDHCWTESDGGKIIPTRTFIDKFAAKEGKSKDWCIAFHCYPADLYQTDIWSSHQYNPKSENAQFVDGYNLEILTGYVKKNYGSQHRILLTEQGFSDSKGADKQAACLVYTFYKAKFDDMVDVMHIMKFQGCGFELAEPAATIWKKLDNGSAEDEQWIFDQVKGTIGVSSWTEIVPNWKSQGDLKNEINADKEKNKCVFDGIDYSKVFDYDYFVKNNPTVVGYYTLDPVKNPPKFEDMFYYFSRYGMDMGLPSSPNFNLEEYKAAHPELVAMYGDDNRAYYTYFCVVGDSDPAQVKAFVGRFYSIILGREGDEAGLSDWTNKLLFKEKTGADVARGFILSQEFKNKGVSNDEYVKKLYAAFFDREPDEGGYSGWMQKIEAGMSREDVLAGFVNSQEFKNLCAKYNIEPGKLEVSNSGQQNNNNQQQNQQNNEQPNNQNNQTVTPLKLDASEVQPEKLDEYVERLYTKILKRDSEEDGKKYWAEVIINGKDA
nr:DUF4214 domain-containing protein [Lachnospiraceae bacterium]